MIKSSPVPSLLLLIQSFVECIKLSDVETFSFFSVFICVSIDLFQYGSFKVGQVVSWEVEMAACSLCFILVNNVAFVFSKSELKKPAGFSNVSVVGTILFLTFQ